jgi:hypothetical protein
VGRRDERERIPRSGQVFTSPRRFDTTVILDIPQTSPLVRASPLDEPVSPELALVDPELRRRLIDISLETVAVPLRTVAEPPSRPQIDEAERSVPAPQPEQAFTAVAPAVRKPFHRRLPLASFAAPTLVVLGYIAATSAPFSHLTGGSAHSGWPATSVSAATLRPPVAGRSAPSGPSVRFAWAPVGGATSYEVEVYHHNVRAYAGSTSQSSIEIPESSSRPALPNTLSPGRYRWYVWPVRAGKRDPVAIVSAQLLVTAR